MFLFLGHKNHLLSHISLPLCSSKISAEELLDHQFYYEIMKLCTDMKSWWIFKAGFIFMIGSNVEKIFNGTSSLTRSWDYFKGPTIILDAVTLSSHFLLSEM